MIWVGTIIKVKGARRDWALICAAIQKQSGQNPTTPISTRPLKMKLDEVTAPEEAPAPIVHFAPGSPELASLQAAADDFGSVFIAFIQRHGRSVAYDVLLNVTAAAIVDLEVYGITDRPMDNFTRLCAEHRKKVKLRKDAT